jgi:hypothetical protein
MIIPSTESIQRRTFSGTPSESVLLTSVPLNVEKQFAAATSELLTINAPAGRTIASIVSVFANMYPMGMTISELSGNYVLQFNATINFTVTLDDANTVILSNTIGVIGEIGSVADIPIVPAPPATAPVIGTSDTGIVSGGSAVEGKITVGAFTMNVTQLMELHVVIDPDF